jgi:hypothetical protein
MDRKFLVDEEVLRKLGILSFDEDGCPGIGKGYDWFPITEVKR